MNLKIGFVGLGLIGGSIAKTLRLYHPECQIVAFDNNPDTLQSALEDGTINISCTDIDLHFENCNYIFLCTPVSYICNYLETISAFCHPNLILTDVGSVKSSIHTEIKRLGLEANFIGGHPMAGSEKSGYAYARSLLLENVYYILTPTTLVSNEKLQAYFELIHSINSLPVVLNHDEHDTITGTVSHLPHILASALVNFVKESDSEASLMKQLAAGGFKDITRIASSSPIMWQHICLENKEKLSFILSRYIDSLIHIKASIESENASELFEMFESAKQYRDSVNDLTPGPIQKVYFLYCDIKDETGGIAALATLLAQNNINIKNIGIVHNREFEEGVLRVEFYETAALQNAVDILRCHTYNLYLH